jgi:hypothetical protein
MVWIMISTRIEIMLLLNPTSKEATKETLVTLNNLQGKPANI